MLSVTSNNQAGNGCKSSPSGRLVPEPGDRWIGLSALRSKCHGTKSDILPPPKKLPTRLLPFNMIRSYNKLRMHPTDEETGFDWNSCILYMPERSEVCLSNQLNTRGFKLLAGHSLLQSSSALSYPLNLRRLLAILNFLVRIAIDYGHATNQLWLLN